MNLQVVTFQRSECMFPCPVMEVHVSGGLCHVYLTSATGCASVYFTIQYCIAWGVPGGSAARSHLQCRRPWSNSWVGKFPWRRAWPPTPSSCLENPHGQRSLAGYSPWGHKESDTTNWLNTAQHCIEYSIFISSPGCPEASIQAGVYSHCVSWVARLTSLDLETHSQNGTQSCIEDLLYWNEDDHCSASVFQEAFRITLSLFAVNWNSLKSMQKTECR